MNIVIIFLLIAITIALIIKYSTYAAPVIPKKEFGAISTIIFDFDGTIADTHALLLTIINNHAHKYGYKKVSNDDYERFKTMHVHEIAQELNFSLLKIPFIIKDVQSDMYTEICSIKPYDGIIPILEKLNQDGYHLGIVSSNNEKNIRLFLKNNKLEIFDFVYCARYFFGKDILLKKIIKQLHIYPNQALYVGDEARDIQAAQKSSLKIIAVTWGYNSSTLLKQLSPEYLIDNPDELYTIIHSLNKLS